MLRLMQMSARILNERERGDGYALSRSVLAPRAIQGYVRAEPVALHFGA